MRISILLTKPCPDLHSLEEEINKLIESDKAKYPNLTQIGVETLESKKDKTKKISVLFAVIYEEIN